MEFFTILLSALLGILSPAGFVVDRLAEDAIRDQLDSAEALAVRIDNAPGYQVLQGRADRIRIAGRGIYPIEGVRIDTLEVETDPIALNPDGFQQGDPQLEQPLQAAIKVVLTETDLNQALQSEPIVDQLNDFNLAALGTESEGQAEEYTLVNPQAEFLENNRLRLQITLQEEQSGTQNIITVESGLAIGSGRQLQLVEPSIAVDDQPLPPELLDFLVGNLSERLDLANLEESGITARVLKLEITGDQLTLIGFVRVEPQ
ncbi:MAG: DUF2993 domain-containing protein [Cyanobacteria bacterium CRU_2_1]|nr:DUF2993 domain-containing protein [Cyanobacteria bacterium RU_5_0]NJR57974.1 DUF2993 domain-containing protein [Cyanobacteria bacterium CRU_2_1]